MPSSAAGPARDEGFLPIVADGTGRTFAELGDGRSIGRQA
jgi:hypothetical protein